MTSARRTPHYVGIISSEPMGPQLMGPHPIVSPIVGPPPAPGGAGAIGRRSGSGILPLHPEQRPRYTPDSERATRPVPTPDVAPLVAAATRTIVQRRVVPVERRPWRVLIVSAAPGVAPKSFEVARWQARTVVASIAIMATLACAFVASVVVAVRSPDLFGQGAEVDALRGEVASMRDSLAQARAELADSGSTDSGDADSSATTAITPVPAAAIPLPAASEPVKADRPKPFSVRPHPAREGAVLALMPRSLADLPVIGALASGFSLARRHPLLHRVRPHLGVDLAAPRGTRVSAPAPGRVSFVGRKVGFGLVVELDHGDGIKTRYAHLRSAAVETGERVTRGEAIAAVGTSGITTGPHLHYEVLVNGRQVDPLRFRFAQSEPAGASAARTPVAPVPAASGPATGAAPHDGAGSALPGPHR